MNDGNQKAIAGDDALVMQVAEDVFDEPVRAGQARRLSRRSRAIS